MKFLDGLKVVFPVLPQAVELIKAIGDCADDKGVTKAEAARLLAAVQALANKLGKSLPIVGKLSELLDAIVDAADERTVTQEEAIRLFAALQAVTDEIKPDQAPLVK